MDSYHVYVSHNIYNIFFVVWVFNIVQVRLWWEMPVYMMNHLPFAQGL